MKIILKKINSDFTKIISLKEMEPLQNIIEKISSINEPLEANIFAINQKINSYELIQFKRNIEKSNINSLHIYSNDRETILTSKSLKIDSTFSNEKELKSRLFLTKSKKQKDVLHKGTVRSGDRISSNGDLFIIGDVNPGAIVSSQKNIYVWGKLLGIAFAGEGGNKNASIASLYLNPLQLRISEIIAIGPKDKPKSHYPEIALLEDQSIIIKPFLMDT
tara:strand:- start:1365 stop:2021 length:657 start_codon:yes stop_codon:yes gene_type:complete